MTRLRRYHLVNNSIIHRLLGSHKEIPITIGLNLILGLIAILGNVRVKDLANEQNFLCLDFNISGLTLRTSKGLMDHDAGVGKGASLAGCAGTEEEGTHGRGHAEAYGANVAGNILHGIVNGHTGRDGSARGVDVEGDVLGRVLVGEVEELGDEDVGDLVVDSLSEEDDAVLEEAGDDILLGGTVVNDGHADGATGGLFIGIFAAGVNLRFRLTRRRSHTGITPAVDSIVDAHDALVLLRQCRSTTAVATIHG
mmetsp:Transcript_5165/g.8140  ORF Transcript_5165/g.8140 Transcript_5165/m.8140 type:complete len:253 (+) Transcript_5165:312-1070(+)